MDDENAIDINSSDVQRIGDDTMNGAIGVQLPNRIIIFSKEKIFSRLPIQYTSKRSGRFSHTVVTGYEKGENVTVLVNGTPRLMTTVSDGGCVDFTINASNTDIIRVVKSSL